MGAVLHAHHVTGIQTATQAAEALRPIAGELAFFLFSLGIIGTELLAVPVLAGSAAYALAEALKWPTGLNTTLDKAKGFYAILGIGKVDHMKEEPGIEQSFANLFESQSLAVSFRVREMYQLLTPRQQRSTSKT